MNEKTDLIPLPIAGLREMLGNQVVIGLYLAKKTVGNTFFHNK